MKYILDNCYFKLGNKISRQVNGIPMGSDSAPFFANLFLFCDDSKWMKKVKMSDIRGFWYLVDLISLNDDE